MIIIRNRLDRKTKLCRCYFDITLCLSTKYILYHARITNYESYFYKIINFSLENQQHVIWGKFCTEFTILCYKLDSFYLNFLEFFLYRSLITRFKTCICQRGYYFRIYESFFFFFTIITFKH